MIYDEKFTRNLLHRHKYVYDEHFNFAEFLNFPLCSAGHYGLYITVDGKVSTCPNMQGDEVDRVDKNSLKTIWFYNDKIRAYREIMESSFYNCINCEASDYCYRCFAMNYTEEGNCMHIPDYVCKMAFLSKRILEK